MKFIILMIVLLPLSAAAQQPGRKIKPGIIAASGVVIGQTKPALPGQLSGGIRYGRYFTGLGMGYDGYRFATLPVFADWRMTLDEKQLVFIYAQPGYNFPVGYKKEEEFAKIADRLKGGFWFDAGLGYRVAAGRRHALALSAGYSLKYVVQEKTYLVCPTCGIQPSTDRYSYNYSRIVLKAGWEFGSR